MAKHAHLTKIVAAAKKLYKKGSAGIKWTTAIKRASSSIHGGAKKRKVAKKKTHAKKRPATKKRRATKKKATKRKTHRRIRGL